MPIKTGPPAACDAHCGLWEGQCQCVLTSNSSAAAAGRVKTRLGFSNAVPHHSPQQSSTGDTDGRYLGFKIIAALLAQCRNPAHNTGLSSGKKSPKHRLFQPTSKSKTRGESHVSSPEVHDGDFRRSAEGRYPTNSIGNVHTYLSPRSFPLPLPSLNLWRAERVPRTMMTTTSDGSYDHPLSYSDQGHVWG